MRAVIATLRLRLLRKPFYTPLALRGPAKQLRDPLLDPALQLHFLDSLKEGGVAPNS